MTHTPQQNRLLAALPPASYESILAKLQPVELLLGWTVYEEACPQRYVYFPTTSIVSLRCFMENGDCAEIAVIGNDGLVGISCMGSDLPASGAVVQNAGHAYRMKATALKKEFQGSSALQQVLLRYSEALITQMAQTAVCNRHHTLDHQVCRALLLRLDRLTSNELTFAHDMIADLLGVRGDCVTEALGKLQRDGVIEYSRGHVTVLDRQKLEAYACECYWVVKKATDRLLVPSLASRGNCLCTVA